MHQSLYQAIIRTDDRYSARTLAAPEVALLALLEVLFGVAWAWLGAGEQPSSAVLSGGALGLGLLVPFLFYRLRKPSWKVAGL